MPRRVPPRGGAHTIWGFCSTSTRLANWQHLVVDRDWPAADYVERTIASIMAEVVAPAEDE